MNRVFRRLIMTSSVTANGFSASLTAEPPTTARRHLIAVCQLTSRHDLNENFQVCRQMVERAKQRGSKMIFFPECFDYIGRSKAETVEMAMAETSLFIQSFRDLAKEHSVWLSLGGFHHKVDGSTRLPYNTHLIIDDGGRTAAGYQKLHLFDLDIPGRVRLMESEFSAAGERLISPVETPIGQLGLSICYDVRFAELALWNRHKGAEILTYPSSFTVNTGLAHWETLLRCRAIETQCYVVAAGQTGKHNDNRSSYGHSMVVDPWGTVVAQCSEAVDMCFAEINLDYLEEIRRMQPVFAHRRSDLYSVIFETHNQVIESQMFDKFPIPKETVFYQTDLSFAFVNLKPILPGHVLCASRRPVKRLTELTDQETADIFIVAKKVQRMIESNYGVTSATVVVQDGPDAGQTVAHIHVHIIPRKATDFGGHPDKIYEVLQGHEFKREPRPLLDMAAEASVYRQKISANDIEKDEERKKH